MHVLDLKFSQEGLRTSPDILGGKGHLQVSEVSRVVITNDRTSGGSQQQGFILSRSGAEV